MKAKIFYTILFSLLISLSAYSSGFGGGNGRKSNPYQISTVDHLLELNQYMGSWSNGHSNDNKYFVLTSDIDLSSFGEWTPLGLNKSFEGKIDGQGYTINGLTIVSTKSKTGLFSKFGYSANAKNITFTNVDIESNQNYLGALCGQSYASGIDNIVVQGVISGASYVGGVSGSSTSGNVTNCSFSGVIVAENRVGGIVGRNDGNKIENCNFDGSIDANEYCGGIVGNSSGTEILNCNVIGEINGGTKTGGIVGSQQWGNGVKNCTVQGSISGTDKTGGISGVSNGAKYDNCEVSATVIGSNYVGGISGHKTNGTIKNCTSIVTVSGENYTGGVAGISSSVDISNCSVTGSITGENYVGGISGRSKWSEIKSCQTAGSVTGKDKVGGLMGYSDGGKATNISTNMEIIGENNVGGICGYSSYTLKLDYCFAFGDVSGVNYVGGLVGNLKGDAKRSYANGVISGVNYVGGLFGRIDWGGYSKCVAANPQIVRTEGSEVYFGKIAGWSQRWETFNKMIASSEMTFMQNGQTYYFPPAVPQYHGTETETAEVLSDPSFYEDDLNWNMSRVEDVLGDSYPTFITAPTNTEWIGDSGDYWGDDANWTNNVPNINSVALLRDNKNNKDETPIIALSETQKCKELQLNSDYTLLIEPSASLQVSSVVNGSELCNVIVTSNAEGSGSFIHNSGSIELTVEQYIPAGGAIIGSPITITDPNLHFEDIETINGDDNLGLDPMNDMFYRWDESASINGYVGVWVDYMQNWGMISSPMHTETFEEGEAYYISYRNNPQTITYSGVATAANITTNVTNTSSSSNPGFNQISNPFIADIAGNSNANNINFLSSNINKLENDAAAIYLWDAATSTYTPVNNLTSAEYIAPGQGFVVVAKNNSNLTFKKNSRIQNPNRDKKRGRISEVSQHLKVQISSESTTTDATSIFFNKESSLGIDKGYDAKKLMNDGANIYTRIPQGANGDFAIMSLPIPSQEQNISLIIDVVEGGDYTLSFDAPQSHNLLYFVKDNETNELYNLKTTNELVVNLASGLTEDRFELIIKRGQNTIIGQANNNNSLKGAATGIDEGVLVTLEEEISGDIVVYDMMGKTIYSGYINNNKKQVVNMSVEASGWYVVKVQSNDNRYFVSKVFLK